MSGISIDQMTPINSLEPGARNSDEFQQTDNTDNSFTMIRPNHLKMSLQLHPGEGGNFRPVSGSVLKINSETGHQCMKKFPSAYHKVISTFVDNARKTFAGIFRKGSDRDPRSVVILPSSMKFLPDGDEIENRLRAEVDKYCGARGQKRDSYYRLP